jgi:hypothetical protein
VGKGKTRTQDVNEYLFLKLGERDGVVGSTVWDGGVASKQRTGPWFSASSDVEDIGAWRSRRRILRVKLDMRLKVSRVGANCTASFTRSRQAVDHAVAEIRLEEQGKAVCLI